MSPKMLPGEIIVDCWLIALGGDYTGQLVPPGFHGADHPVVHV